MTLRITLLVVATGLFSLIWIQDQQSPRSRTAEIPSRNLNAKRPDDIQANATALNRSRGESAPLQTVSVNAARNVDQSDVPLPAGIVPGEYRVVSQTGLVQPLTLSRDQLPSEGVGGEFVTREIYRSKGGTLCWYFVRVQSDAEAILPDMARRGRRRPRPAIAERLQTPHRPAIAEKDHARSIRKQVRKQAGRIILRTGRRAIHQMSAILKNRKL